MSECGQREKQPCHVGKQPIPVPARVDVTIEGQSISVKGPKGTLGLTVAEGQSKWHAMTTALSWSPVRR